MARQKNLVRRHEILRNTFILLKKRGMENVSLQMIADKFLKDYIYWFNNVRRSNKLKYTTPVKYRNRVLSNL